MMTYLKRLLAELYPRGVGIYLTRNSRGTTDVTSERWYPDGNGGTYARLQLLKSPEVRRSLVRADVRVGDRLIIECPPEYRRREGGGLMRMPPGTVSVTVTAVESAYAHWSITAVPTPRTRAQAAADAAVIARRTGTPVPTLDAALPA